MKKISSYSMSVRFQVGTARNSSATCGMSRTIAFVLNAQKARSEEYQKESTEGKGFNACDTYALAAAINEALVTEMEEVRRCRLHSGIQTELTVQRRSQVAVSVELEGKYTRGMMVMDYMELLNKKHKAFVMKTVDLEKFKEMLMKSLQ